MSVRLYGGTVLLLPIRLVRCFLRVFCLMRWPKLANNRVDLYENESPWAAASIVCRHPLDKMR